MKGIFSLVFVALALLQVTVAVPVAESGEFCRYQCFVCGLPNGFTLLHRPCQTCRRCRCVYSIHWISECFNQLAEHAGVAKRSPWDKSKGHGGKDHGKGGKGGKGGHGGEGHDDDDDDDGEGHGHGGGDDDDDGEGRGDGDDDGDDDDDDEDRDDGLSPNFRS
jgi:hypothetical protein